MSFKNIKENRKVRIINDDQFEVSAEIIDIYDPSNVYAMLRTWEEQVKMFEQNEANFDEELKNNRVVFEETMQAKLNELEKNLKLKLERERGQHSFNKRMLEIWSPEFFRWAKKNQRKFDKIVKDFKKINKEVKDVSGDE